MSVEPVVPKPNFKPSRAPWFLGALQFLGRSAPKLLRAVWNRLPDGARLSLSPGIYPVALSRRGGGFVLDVPAGGVPRRFDVLVSKDALDGPRARDLAAAGHRIVSFDPSDPTGSLAKTAADAEVLDAVVLDPSEAQRAEARALGFRCVETGTGTDRAALDEAFPLVSIVVITHSNREACRACLDSIVRATGWGRYEVIVVDNGPANEERAALRELVERTPRMRMLEDAPNSFAAACNTGIRDATGEFVVLLNDDTLVSPGWVSRLVAALERDDRLGLITPVTNEIGNRARVEVEYQTFDEMTKMAVGRAFREAGEVVEVDVIALFCAAARRSVLEEVGLLDERYEIGMFEDDDLCIAVRARGYRLGIASDAFVHHIGQASFGKLKDSEYLAIWTANRQRFEEKWGTPWTAPLGARTRVVLGPRGPFAMALATYLFVACAYFMPAPTWNPASRFALTRAIVERSTLEITPYAATTGDRANVGGHFFSDKAPVPSFMAVPFFAAQRTVSAARGYYAGFRIDAARTQVIPNVAFQNGLYACSLATSGVAFAVLGVALFEIVRRRTGEHVACITAVVTLLGTPLYPYATSFFGHTIAAAFLFAAFALTQLGRRPWRLVLGGLLLGLSIGSEYVCAIPAVILAVTIALDAPRAERARRVYLLLAGAFAPLAALAAYHSICFGAPWTTGHSFGHRTGAADVPSLIGITATNPRTIAALLFGRARGLFYVAPISAAALWCGALAWKRTRDRRLVIAALVLGSLLVANASYAGWDGGAAIGPRHLVPAFGFLGLGVAAGLTQPRWRILMGVAAIGSMGLMLLATAIGVEAPPGGDAIFGYLVPHLREGHIARIAGASNWGMKLGLSPGASLLPILGWIVLGAGWLISHCRPLQQAVADPNP
jgi:GT2 family glycosyltransferase